MVMNKSDDVLEVELNHCFQFWDDFIRKWLKGNLDSIVSIPKYTDMEHLPEPWWGWNGNGRLNSVVINYHPGPGGLPQSRKIIEELFSNEFSYREIMGNDLKKQLSDQQRRIGVRKTTDYWHLNFRAKKFEGLINEPVSDTSRHLSIEFSPFHNDNCKKVGDFVKSNPEIVKRYILGFAAIAAERCIAKDSSLHNKVFVRVSNGNFVKYLESLKLTFKSKGTPSFKLHTDNPNYSIHSYIFEEWPDTEFIVVTGSRNYFPEIEKTI